MANFDALDLAACPSFQKLNLQQQLFVTSYLKDFNATRAAIEAKYSKKTAAQSAARLLNSVNIRAALQEVAGKVFSADIATAAELQALLSNQATANIIDYAEWDEGGNARTIASDKMSRAQSACIKKLKFTERISKAGDWTESKVELELHDPQNAAELLLRCQGAFKDKVEQRVIIAKLGDINLQPGK